VSPLAVLGIEEKNRLQPSIGGFACSLLATDASAHLRCLIPFMPPRKGRHMAKHTVKVATPQLTLGKADVVFEVFEDESKLGELCISTGAAVWYPTGASYAKKLSWAKLNALFIEHGADRAESKKRRSSTKP
jgi:hypothetical protein